MYKKRISQLTTWMNENEIKMAVFEDAEGRRDPAIRYFTGHPSDAVLLVKYDGKTMLVAWDEILAEKLATADVKVALSDFAKNPLFAIGAGARFFELCSNDSIEVSSRLPYPQFLDYVDYLSDFHVICREKGLDKAVADFRAVKDEDEIALIREATSITNKIIDLLEKKLQTSAASAKGCTLSETDIALFLEKTARAFGCEKMSFDTLAAGPARSFGIHAFPGYTSDLFAPKIEDKKGGLSILDFGIVWKGYASDVTLTIVSGTLSEEQEKQLQLVQQAFDIALPYYKAGVSVRTAAKKVDTLFRKNKRAMPHGLGHGVGLEIHESPFVRDREGNDAVFTPGMVVTLEPGLYDAKLGGCRYENDVLITKKGPEVLTKSRIIRL